MDSDEETEYEPSWRGVPGLIILINVFENGKHNIFEIAHVATCRLIKQHMRSSSSHNVAVCLCGVEESSSSKFDINPLMEIIPLSVPTLNDYKKLRSITPSYFNEAKEFKLSDALWHCSKMFANCKKQLSTRSIVMLTRLEISPIISDQKPTLNRASDLIDSNIDIRIINISNQEYPINTYYEKFLKIAYRGMDYIAPKPISNTIDIEKLMHQESHRHFALAKLNFEISEDFNIGVGVYSMLKRSSLNFIKNVKLHRETNSLITSITKTMKSTVDDHEGEQDNSQPKAVPLIKSELLYQQEYGGEMVEFTDSEMKTIKNQFGPPKMKLLGFKPLRMICKEKWYMKMGYFLFPNEKEIEGSTVAFKALHKACTDMQMVAISILCTRVNAKPTIVALCPCEKLLNLDVDIGFDIVHLPFVESVRDLIINEDDDNEQNVVIEEANKTLMKDILNELLMDYQSDMFEDPKVQSQYRAIEAIALGEEDCDEFIDTTIPSPERFENIKDDLFEELFGPFGDLSLKRKPTKLPSQCGKKQKVEGIDIDEGLLDSRLKSKKIHDYSVAQLKQILKLKKFPTGLTGLKKNELVDLVYNHCNS